MSDSTTATYVCNELSFSVRILDTKRHFGREDCLVTPVAGSGERWITKRNLQFTEDAPVT